MAERSLLGSSGTETLSSAALELPSDGCCGDMSFWMIINIQICQADGLGELLQL